MTTSHDVGTEDFQQRVIERSRELPVLVDFWAEWCAPCRTLGPVLDTLADEMAGEIELAKVNTETNPELAARYGISSIPAVKLFRDGRVVDQFVGALPPARVREFVRKHIPSAAQLAVDGALRSLLAGDPAEAGRLLHAAEAEDRRLVAESEVARYVREALDLCAVCEDAGGETASRGRADASPDDLNARFSAACCSIAAGRFQDALDELLAIVATDRKHRDEAARKAMLTLFGVLGIRSPLSDEYRNKLAVYL